LKNIKYAIVVAKAQNDVIGGENRLLWHLPADMRFFKNLTSGHIVIMGRKTFESIGRPLPNRVNIVVSRQYDIQADGLIMAKSLEQALDIADELTAETEKQIFVIGGAQIYKLALPNAHTLYVTNVYTDVKGDSFFPEIDTDIWQESNKVCNQPDEKNIYSYDFLTYTRK
jgi:dihydrofolate reductase